MHDESHFEPIYRHGVLEVRGCRCGMIHLGVGPVTLKLTRDAFDQVLVGMKEAGRRLAERGAPAVGKAAEPPAPYLSLVRDRTVQ